MITRPRAHRPCPMSYIIDRDGNVVVAWYGYEEGESKSLRF